MPLGTAQRLSVQGTYSDNSTADLSNSVKWASSSESVASITSVGDVSADGLGVATISASAGAVGASIDLNQRFSIQATVENVTNKLALTEGNIRAAGSGNTNGFFLGRPIFGRHATITAAYKF